MVLQGTSRNMEHVAAEDVEGEEIRGVTGEAPEAENLEKKVCKQPCCNFQPGDLVQHVVHLHSRTGPIGQVLQV